MGCLSSRPPDSFRPSMNTLHHLATQLLPRPSITNWTMTNQFYSDQAMNEGSWCSHCFRAQTMDANSVIDLCRGNVRDGKSVQQVPESKESRWAGTLSIYVKKMQSTAEYSCQLTDEGADCSWCLQNVISWVFVLWPHLPWKPAFLSSSLKQDRDKYGEEPLKCGRKVRPSTLL